MTKTKHFFSKLSVKSWIISGVSLVVVVSYGLVFFTTKTIDFSYADTPTCKGHFVVAPGAHRFSSSEFDATFEGGWKIGNVTLVSSKVCVEPKQAPKAGTYTAQVAPFGGFFAAKQFKLVVPEAPAARSSDIVGKQISTTEPLVVQLDDADALHKYTLRIDDKKGDCTQKEAKLSCDVRPLELAQGTSYTAALYKSYKTTNVKVLEGEVETLRPLVMASSSITDGQTVYDKPTEVTVTFDRVVEKGEVSLVKIVGDNAERVDVTKEVNGTTMKVVFAELAREAAYRLDVAQAVSDNGSSLAAPISIKFVTSGGPKVTSVSVGAHSVARNARVIVSFDQPIDKSADITKLARIEGVGGAVQRQSDTQLAFALKGGDCTAFNLVVDKGLKSASNDQGSKDPWKFSSRTICGSSWSIGNSVRGRPIMAHSFGSGSSVILFTGGMHGSEPSGYTTMQAWVQHLQAYGDIVPAGKRVVIVPNTNPDGIAGNTRYNSRNVNIGRNFPTANWSASIQTSSGTQVTGGGTSPGSEPEASALIALTRQLRPRLEVSFHAQGRLVGANKFRDSTTIGDIYAKIVGYRTIYYDAEAVMGYPMTGEYEDWMGEEMNIPAILIELPSHSGNYFNTQLPALRRMLDV